jgi:hypothetical protein
VGGEVEKPSTNGGILSSANEDAPTITERFVDEREIVECGEASSNAQNLLSTKDKSPLNTEILRRRVPRMRSSTNENSLLNATNSSSTNELLNSAQNSSNNTPNLSSTNATSQTATGLDPVTIVPGAPADTPAAPHSQEYAFGAAGNRSRDPKLARLHRRNCRIMRLPETTFERLLVELPPPVVERRRLLGWRRGA